MNRSIRKFVTGLFPVSRNAGRLRFILAALLLFIFWTIIAQNNSAGIGDFFGDQSETNFIVGIIRELLNRYFGISTLVLTFIPVILFVAAFTQTATFLEALFPDIRQDKATMHFLKNCAFSFQHDTKGQAITSESNMLEAEQKIGGPAELAIDNSDLLITESYDEFSYKVFFFGDTQDKHQIHLEHKERIYAIVPKSNLQFQVNLSEGETKQGNLNTKEMISINPNISGNTQSIHQSHVVMISKQDAWFLKEAANPNNLIHDYFEQEIYKYFRDQESDILINSQGESNTIDNNERVDKRQSHSNYSQLINNNSINRKGFIRKHRRSQYGIFDSTNENEITQVEQTVDINGLQINKLNDYLEKQMVSFFSLSNLSIKIKSKGQI